MVLHSAPNRDKKFNDLLQWHCSSCAHIGVTASQGLQLVFRGGQEYIFTFGGSMTTLSVVLTGPAIGLFRTHMIGADELAWRAAEWALLRGRVGGTVRLDLQSYDLADLYLYLYADEVSGHKRSEEKASAANHPA
jgi:hypothetical protein